MPGCGNLKSFDEPVDAIIYGRDLKASDDNLASEERFDKIRYYLRHSIYPQGANRSEKSRLRSAAMHYKLVGGDDGEPEKLMLKGKEVVSEPQQQYQIAKEVHDQNHAGINKTTATISTQYHWTRIKETVSHVIKNCTQCKESAKVASLPTEEQDHSNMNGLHATVPVVENQPSAEEQLAQMTLESNQLNGYQDQSQLLDANVGLQDPNDQIADYDEMTLDPQLMEQLHAQFNTAYVSDPDAFSHPRLQEYDPAQQIHPALSFPQHSGHYISDPSAALMHHDQLLNGHPRHPSLQLPQGLIPDEFVHDGDAGGTYPQS